MDIVSNVMVILDKVTFCLCFHTKSALKRIERLFISLMLNRNEYLDVLYCCNKDASNINYSCNYLLNRFCRYLIIYNIYIP